MGTSLLITCEMSAAGAELCIHTSQPSRGVQQVQGQHRWVREAGWAQSPSSYPPNRDTGYLAGRVGPQAANKAGDMQRAAEPGGGGCQAPCRACRWKAILPLGTTLGTGGAARCGAVMDGAMRHGWEAGAGLEPGERVKGLWCGCPVYHGHPMHDGYPMRCGHCVHNGHSMHRGHPTHPVAVQCTVGTPRSVAIPTTTGISHTVGAPYPAGTPRTTGTLPLQTPACAAGPPARH